MEKLTPSSSPDYEIPDHRSLSSSISNAIRELTSWQNFLKFLFRQLLWYITSAANTSPTILNKIHWVCTLSLLKLAAFSRVFATFTSLIRYHLESPWHLNLLQKIHGFSLTFNVVLTHFSLLVGLSGAISGEASRLLNVFISPLTSCIKHNNF